jgi:hypothetical protein
MLLHPVRRLLPVLLRLLPLHPLLFRARLPLPPPLHRLRLQLPLLHLRQRSNRR